MVEHITQMHLSVGGPPESSAHSIEPPSSQSCPLPRQWISASKARYDVSRCPSTPLTFKPYQSGPVCGGLSISRGIGFATNARGDSTEVVSVGFEVAESSP